MLLAYCGGQDISYLLSLLALVAAREGSDFGYYLPSSTSKSACSERAFVTIGAQSDCKEFLPEAADVLLALEELEGRRAARFLSKEGVCVLCSCHRLPMAVAVGTTGYPTDILYRMVSEGRHVWQVKRTEMKNDYVSAMLLRALGYDKDAAKELLMANGTDIEEASLQAAYDKQYSQ